ncbi:hypothetical protein [Arthrobacter sp. FW306-07-I]|uniref:hypothetical protein n=1 Tax=Arthrobacter sp. FW306-07-I TaxID=2879622 RepID=UPI001F3DD1B8|nr:hypothetical protein [Arthrobacter sp. FW306-07-I]UKA73814.1 hypothetical protein LFT46_11420 [Arthrobacter sp. FW306-07-I]
MPESSPVCTRRRLRSRGEPPNVAAGLLVLAEAGGITTDWKGQDLHFRAGTDTINLAASNGWVHGEMLEVLGKLKMASALAI